jgi:hypothetical protein
LVKNEPKSKIVSGVSKKIKHRLVRTGVVHPRPAQQEHFIAAIAGAIGVDMIEIKLKSRQIIS